MAEQDSYLCSDEDCPHDQTRFQNGKPEGFQFCYKYRSPKCRWYKKLEKERGKKNDHS